MSKYCKNEKKKTTLRVIRLNVDILLQFRSDESKLLRNRLSKNLLSLLYTRQANSYQLFLVTKFITDSDMEVRKVLNS